MDDARLVKISRFLSKHLRHRPEGLGLRLAPGGWVAVGALLAACAERGLPLTRAELNEVVARNDKQRFAIDPTGARIRASQGHSVAVELGLEPTTPPDVLYHGTSDQAVPAILGTGLRKMRRHHVHLSTDIPTARRVGTRHGRPAIVAVDAAAMHRAGHSFYRSANGVWLVASVPPRYVRLVEASAC